MRERNSSGLWLGGGTRSEEKRGTICNERPIYQHSSGLINKGLPIHLRLNNTTGASLKPRGTPASLTSESIAVSAVSPPYLRPQPPSATGTGLSFEY